MLVYKQRMLCVKSEHIPIEWVKSVNSSKNLCDFFLQAFLENEDDICAYEASYILLLSQANHPLGYAKISQGNITSCPVSPRIIAKHALDVSATQVALCHNHPSGSNGPSQPDIDITRKVYKALDLLDIVLIDHIIISNGGYYSFADEGLI